MSPPSGRRLSPTCDPPPAPSTSRLVYPPSDLGSGPTSSPKRNQTSSASRPEPHEASTSPPSGSDSQKSSTQFGESTSRSRDTSGRYQCEGEPSAKTTRTHLAFLSPSSDRATGRSSGDSHATKSRALKAVEQAPKPREQGSSPVHKTRSSGASSSTYSASPAFSIWVKGMSKARMTSSAASNKPSTSTPSPPPPGNESELKKNGASSSASDCIPDSRTRSRTPSPTEAMSASWGLAPKLEPSLQMGPKSHKPTSSVLRARYPTPPISISSARGSSVDLRTYHESHGGMGPAEASIDVIFIDDTDDDCDDERDGRPSSPKRARYSRDYSDEEEPTSNRQRKGTSPTNPLGGPSRRNTSRTTDPRSPVRSSTIPTPEQYSVDPELFIASANWSRRIIIDVLSFKIDCIALSRDVPDGQDVDHELELELALVANVDGCRTELDLVDECVCLERCTSNATRLIFTRSRTHIFELDFDPTAFRTATDVQLEITLRNLDGEEWNAKASLPLSDCDVRGEEHIIPYGAAQTLRFSKTTTARIAYRSAAMMDDRISELESSARELDRRLDRVRLENDPVWLPDAFDVASIRYQEAREVIPGQHGVLQPVDRGPTRSTYDFVTKRPLIMDDRIMEPSTTETPFSTIQVRQQLNALLLRTSYTAKERLVRRLHHSWTILNPFPPSILARELACWNHFAPVVEHFMAGQELEWFLWTSLVMKGERGQYRGLLSVSEWEEVRKMYRKQIRKIEKGKRQSYEVWRRRIEESVG